MEKTVTMIKGEEAHIIKSYSEHCVKICRKGLKYYQKKWKHQKFLQIGRLVH